MQFCESARHKEVRIDVRAFQMTCESRQETSSLKVLSVSVLSTIVWMTWKHIGRVIGMNRLQVRNLDLK